MTEPVVPVAPVVPGGPAESVDPADPLAGARVEGGDAVPGDGAAAGLVATVVGLGIVVATALRFAYAFEAKDFVWYDSLQYIGVSQHPLLSTAFWSGNQPPLVPLMWKLTGSPTGFAVLQCTAGALAWSFLAWTVWTWLGRGIPAGVAAWVVLAFSLTPFVLQWDASVLSEAVSLAAVATIFGAGLWLVREFTWPWAALLVAAGLVLELARDAGLEVVALTGLAIAVIAAANAVRHRGRAAVGGAVLAGVILVTSGLVGLAALQAHRNVLNVENSLYVRVFPYPAMVADFAAHGMPEATQIDAVAQILKAEQPTPLAYASPPPSATTALVVGPILTEAYWQPLRKWIDAHGEATYLTYLLSHPGYVLTAPFHRPSLAFNSPATLSYYQIYGHNSFPGLWILFPGRLYVGLMAAVAAGLMVVRGIWRRWEVALVAAMLPLGVFAMAVGWFGDGQEIARHMIEGNVMIRLAVLLLLLWGLLAPGRVAEGPKAPATPR